jgi:hypothetical protein
MNCNDPLVAALKDVGYNVVRLPRADIAPLQILVRRRSNLDFLGTLDKLILGVEAPRPKLDEPVTSVKGQSTRTGALDANLGLGILGSIIAGMTGKSIGLEAGYKNSSALSFEFLDGRRDAISIDELDRFLTAGRLDSGSRHLSRLVESDRIYVVTATLKSNKILVNSHRADGTTASADIPLIKGVLAGTVKVGTQGESSSALTYEGEKPLIFGFQATRILFRRGEYDGLEVVDPGTLAMRSLDQTGPAVGEGPATDADSRLVVLETRRTPLLIIGSETADADQAMDAGATALTRGGPGRKALVIGINTYANLKPPFNKLNGCVNDAEAMSQTLREQFGFAAADIELLTDEHATREAILGAFDRLVDRTATGDLVVVHYSGHGSQVPDLEGDEPDGLDETIVPHDSGRADPETGSGPANRDITDDEIYERLRKLSAKTDAITLIFDSCHSGTISRDAFGELTRYVEPDLRAESGRPKPSVSPEAIAELKQALQSSGSRDVGPTGFLPLNSSYVLIAGCSDKERSFEYRARTAGSVPHGALTFFLLREIASAQPGETYRDVFERAEARITTIYSSQHPQLEGDADRVLFGTRRFVPMRHVTVTQVRPKRIQIGAGAAHGLLAGAVYAVYAQGVKQIGPDTPRLGTFRVENVRAFDSDAVPVDVPDISTVEPGSRAVEIERVMPPMSEVVACDDLTPGARCAQDIQGIRDYLASSNLLRPDGEGREPTIKIYALPSGGPDQRKGAVPSLGELKQPAWATVGLDGQPLTRLIPFAETGAVDTLLDNLAKIAQYRNVLAIRNPDASCHLAGKVDLIILKQNADRSWSEAGEGAVFREGDRMALRIENQLDHPVYASIIDFGLSHAIAPVFPVPGSKPEIAKSTTFDYGVAEGGFKLEFPDRYPRDEGKETLKMIVTTVPSDFSVLRQAGTRGLEDLASAKAPNPIEQLLAQAAGGTRELVSQPSAIDQWYTVERSFTLRR